MTGLHTFFSSICFLFQLLWASTLGFFRYKVGPDANSCDIEAGIPPLKVFNEPTIDADSDPKPATCLSIPIKDDFVEIDMNKQPATSNTSSVSATRRTLPVDPVKSRIINTSLKQIHDRTTSVIKTVVVNPGTAADTSYSAEVEYVNLRIVRPSNAQKQPLARLSEEGKGLDSFPKINNSFETASVKMSALPRTSTIRNTRNTPKHKIRAVQFALPPIEIPDLFMSYKGLKRKRDSDIFDLLNQFPTPPVHVEHIFPPPSIRPDKFNRCARRFCIFRKSASADGSTSSSGCDTTVLSISVSGDTLESSALETPDTIRFSPLSEAVKTGGDPFYCPSDLTSQELDDTSDSPTKPSLLPLNIHNQEALLTQRANICKHTDADSDDLIMNQGPHEDSDSTEGAEVELSYLQFLSILSASPSDGSDTTVDQLRAQLEDATFDSIQRSQSLVWRSDRSITEDLRIPEKHMSWRLVAADKPNGGKHTNMLLEDLREREHLHIVLEAIRETDAIDLDFCELFYRDSSLFCRSSLADRATSYSSEVTGRASSKRADQSAEEILAVLNLPDPIEDTAEDAIWAFSWNELGFENVSLDVSSADVSRRNTCETPTASIAMVSEIGTNGRKAETLSGDESDQWHDAVLDLNA